MAWKGMGTLILEEYYSGNKIEKLYWSPFSMNEIHRKKEKKIST